ncbi:ArsR/SmtB family transcription factor [Kitasatospora sp. NPDC058965]|uniref:ArsR/SmtB family transcription factor n=1 Tax=Kitasatospora sp. NPDC058965 TaxID=3346682 RepID=UPI0036921491
MRERAEERLVDDVATLKALADPVRLAILKALNQHERQPLTAKELAAELGEPQTKLYRHLKQLEKAELIEVAGTRLVSGIVESRYRARQRDLRLAAGIFAEGSAERPEALAAVLAGLDSFRQDFERAVLSERMDLTRPDDGAPGVFRHGVFRLTPERAVELRAELREVLTRAGADEVPAGEPAVDVKVFTLMYTERD